ncbi:MAG: Gas vesicle synthesis protein GvpL/GvpF [Acidobacteria bacterium]|nr:Gas vesicle synthesis protein GvpL/GvpF [Acidobacteriota bacterium]
MPLYVYAITREPRLPHGEAVDQSAHFGAVEAGGISAIYTKVADDELSQEVIDRRAGDLEWLGSVGYRHQAVVARLMRETAIVPLRAFTMFSSEAALAAYLMEHREQLVRVLDRLDGKQEWTLRIEFDPQRWSEALIGRVESLRTLAAEIESAGAGKAFLLRKKLEEEKKRASRDAERSVVAELEEAVAQRLACEVVAESRERRDGAFPQINVLINRDEESVLQELYADLVPHYEREGVTLGLTGPWPPYTFATAGPEAGR